MDNTMSLRIRWCREMSCWIQRAAQHMWTFATAILVQTWNMLQITSLSTCESFFYQVHWALTTRRNILPSCIMFSIYRLVVWFLSWILFYFFKKRDKQTDRVLLPRFSGRETWSHNIGSKDVSSKLTAPKPQFINLSRDYVHGSDTQSNYLAGSAMETVSAWPYSHCWWCIWEG